MHCLIAIEHQLITAQWVVRFQSSDFLLFTFALLYWTQAKSRITISGSNISLQVQPFQISFVHINSHGKNNCRNSLWLALQLWIFLKFIQSAQFTAADVRTVHRCGSSSNTCDIKIYFISQFPACGLRLLRVLCVFTPVQALQGHHQLWYIYAFLVFLCERCIMHAGSSLFRWLWYTTESNVLNMLYN